MRLRNIGTFVCCLLGGCASSGPSVEQLASSPRRELAPAEKISLAGSLSQTLKDPGSAQFRWMPLIINPREGINDYCGLVNGRNSYGGYAGYQKFYAQLFANGKGQFDSGLIKLVASDEVNTIATDGQCEKYGYVDFNQAK